MRPKFTSGVRAERVAHIASLKASMRWRYGATVQQLAAEWGVGENYVHELTGEANRQIRHLFASPEDVAADVVPALLDTFRAAADMARSHPSSHVRANAAMAVAKIGRLLAELAGLIAPRRRKAGLAIGLSLRAATASVVSLAPYLPPRADDRQPDARAAA